MHKFSQAGEIKCLKNGRIEGDCLRNDFLFFIKREAGDMNVSFITGLFIKKHLKWIIIILRCLEETKISIQELRNEEKILRFFKYDYYRLFKLPTAYDIIS